MEETQFHWEDPAWHARAAGWIRSEAQRAGAHLTGEIEQPHLYPWSTVLRVPTDRGLLYFKASAVETLHEAALTARLAGWYPDRIPELVAVDEARGWMLMRDGGEALRASIRPVKDISPWAPVIGLYAALQVDAAAHVDEMLALGVPDWRLARLPGLWADLLADTDLLRVGQPNGLTPDEDRRVRDLAPRFESICTDLAAFGLPASLNHGDFHDGNVLVREGRVIFFDWGDANITHPFVVLRTFFVSIEIALDLPDYSFTPEMESLLAVYLRPWEPFASAADLRSAYFLSRPVASVVKALAWAQTVSRLEGGKREEYVHIVPALVQEFLHYESRLAN